MVDWNADGLDDIVSGDREGYFNVFVRNPDSTLTAYYQFRLADSTVLDVGSNSQPAVVDWNGDGRKDLILGTETGYIRFYPNIGTDSAPAFLNYEHVQAAGADINLYRVNPYVFDLDRDGVNDLICGANDGYVRFYRNTGSNARPVLAAPESLRTRDGNFIQPLQPYAYGSRLGPGYWNADSFPDLLLSGYDGMVLLFRGTPYTGMAEPGRPELGGPAVPGRVVRNVLEWQPGETGVRAELVDAVGRRVLVLSPGSNDVTGLAPGSYFVVAGRTLTRVLVCR